MTHYILRQSTRERISAAQGPTRLATRQDRIEVLRMILRGAEGFASAEFLAQKRAALAVELQQQAHEIGLTETREDLVRVMRAVRP
jgi:hypothetical protein